MTINIIDKEKCEGYDDITVDKNELVIVECDVIVWHVGIRDVIVASKEPKVGNDDGFEELNADGYYDGSTVSDRLVSM